MTCKYDTIAIVLFFVTAIGCMLYVSKLKQHYKSTETLHNEYKEYLKK